MFRKPKEIYKYNILEKYKINIDEENRTSRNACVQVTKNRDYAFYRYKAFPDGSGGYILRQDLKNPKNIVFFGKSKIFNVVYKDYLFQVDKDGEMGRFGITARDVRTGRLEEFNWLGKKAVYLIIPGGYGRFFSQDSVEDVYVKDDKLFFKCYREQSLDPYHNAVLPDKYDVTAEFTLIVDGKTGNFIPTTVFRDEDILSDDAARRRLLIKKDDDWYERERQKLLEKREWRMKRTQNGSQAIISKEDNQSEQNNTRSDETIQKPVIKKELPEIPTIKPIAQQVNHEPKYWMDENGTVRCPGDDCPKDCTMECPIYLQTLAMTQLQNNKFENAARLFRQAVEREPAFADAWNNLAACYGQLGDHQKAYGAYKTSYETKQKPNPLYGMAVAAKNLKDYDLSRTHATTYINRFGSDDRIQALLAEISENKLSEKINSSENKLAEVPKPKKTSVEPITDQPLQFPKSVSKEPVIKTDPVPAPNEASVDDMHRFGKLYLLLLDPDTREAGYAAMEKMENSFPEAAICLGQYYNGKDQGKAKAHFRVAANAGIAEGQWSYSQLLPHSYVLDFSLASDREYLKYCLAAAEGGCPDAANEMGNICHRKEFYEESTYWYGMAYALEHPSGITSLRGITKEWDQKGVSKEFVAHIDGFTEERHATALILYKMFVQSLAVQDLNDMMLLALKGENLAGLIQAKIMEQHNKYDSAYMAYKVLMPENHPYVIRCYADMLLAGKGTTRDVNAAFQMYEQSARGGNATAMFTMGQKAAKDGDKYLAACWFGQAYSRGMNMAGDWLSKLVE